MHKMSLSGVAPVGGTVVNAGVALAAGSALNAEARVIHLVDDDEISAANLGQAIEKVTAEVNRHGIAGLTPAQLLIAVVFMLAIGAGIGEKAGVIDAAKVGSFEPPASYAACLIALILALDRHKNK